MTIGEEMQTGEDKIVADSVTKLKWWKSWRRAKCRGGGSGRGPIPGPRQWFRISSKKRFGRRAGLVAGQRNMVEDPALI